MIRFVDLTEIYWTYGSKPCCAFLNTVSDCFIGNEFGTQVFDNAEDLDSIVPVEYRERCKEHVPDGFWERPQ